MRTAGVPGDGVRGRRCPCGVGASCGESGDALAFDAGRTSRANLAARPAATLLWPSRSFDNGEYSLIVDGDGVVTDDGDVVVVHPAAAVLHRIAGSAAAGPAASAVLSRD